MTPLSSLVTRAIATPGPIGLEPWSKFGIALPAAFVGALVSAAEEGWHAYSHLQLSTRGGPIAETVAALGFIAVVVALWHAERQGLRRPVTGIDGRRAA